MRAGPIVIFHVTEQQVTEVALAEYNDVVKAFPSDRTDQPFSISILPRGARQRRSEDIPSQSRRRHRVDGPIRGSDNLIPTALRAAATASRSPPNPVVGGDCAPNGRMDFAPTHRGLW